MYEGYVKAAYAKFILFLSPSFTFLFSCFANKVTKPILRWFGYKKKGERKAKEKVYRCCEG